MSTTSPASGDSNPEKDFEYAADDDYNTEPEIIVTRETESEAEPRMGQEAESRFTSGAEASTSAPSDDDLLIRASCAPMPITSPGVVAKLGPISKTLNSTARELACDALRAQSCRLASTLLDYKPSCKGVLKRKEKKKDGEPSEKDQQRKENQPISDPTQKKRKRPPETEGAQKKRQLGVRLPKIGYTAAEWLTPLRADEVFEAALLGLNIPLKAVEPNADEMSRRGIPRPAIPTKTANPPRNRGSSDQQLLQEKKQKTNEDAPPPNVSQPPSSTIARASPAKEQKGILLIPTSTP
ncbi:hypothetical protein RHMOL_Rhmol04G0255100 [Rhododendron molle]|uniref:Uncharacterized protein n=1 Tax=Rhododendron molle TaxID=49168 RepID=A0ACC0P453_RHOML|nr:hypothetical protein RHMOL_Rhmol04G0255100 [Rhododendron molle]